MVVCDDCVSSMGNWYDVDVNVECVMGDWISCSNWNRGGSVSVGEIGMLVIGNGNGGVFGGDA